MSSLSSFYHTIVGRRVQIQCLQWFYASLYAALRSIIASERKCVTTRRRHLSCATSYVTWRESLCQWNEPLHASPRVHLVTYAKLKKKKNEKKRKKKNERKHLVSTGVNALWRFNIRYNTTRRRCKNLHSIFHDDRKSSCLRERLRRDRKVNVERNKL